MWVAVIITEFCQGSGIKQTLRLHDDAANRPGTDRITRTRRTRST